MKIAVKIHGISMRFGNCNFMDNLLLVLRIGQSIFPSTKMSDESSGISRTIIIIVIVLFLVSAGVALYFLLAPSDPCTLANLWDEDTPCTAREQEQLTFDQCQSQGGKSPCLTNCNNLLGNRDPCEYFENTPCKQVYSCTTCSKTTPLEQCNDKPLLNSANEALYCLSTEDSSTHNCDNVCEILHDRGELYLANPQDDTVNIRYLRCEKTSSNYCLDTQWCDCSVDNITGCTTREQLDIQLEVCESGYTNADKIDDCSLLCERYAVLYGDLSCENPACRNMSEYCCSRILESGEGECENPFVLIELIEQQC